MCTSPPYKAPSIFLPHTQSNRTTCVAFSTPLHSGGAITSGLVDGKIDPVVAQTVARISNVDAGALTSAAQARIDGSGAFIVAHTEEDFRRQEHHVLSDGGGRSDG